MDWAFDEGTWAFIIWYNLTLKLSHCCCVLHSGRLKCFIPSLMHANLLVCSCIPLWHSCITALASTPTNTMMWSIVAKKSPACYYKQETYQCKLGKQIRMVHYAPCTVCAIHCAPHITCCTPHTTGKNLTSVYHF